MTFQSGVYEFQVTLTNKRVVHLPGTIVCGYVDQLRSHMQELTRGFTLFEDEGIVETYTANAIFKVTASVCKQYED